MNSKERMKSWKDLDMCEQVSWETWKRILQSVNDDTTKAKEKWEKIAKKKLDKQG
jgi:hypothetical protein|tara:strand:+ start:1765 stop:1929 length:165 start_codon:yes stop_codon:yes gene_type:complete